MSFSKESIISLLDFAGIKSEKSIIAFFKLVALLCSFDKNLENILYISNALTGQFIFQYIENYLQGEKGIKFIKKTIDIFSEITDRKGRSVDSKITNHKILIFDLISAIGLFDKCEFSSDIFDLVILRSFGEDDFDIDRVRYFVDLKAKEKKKIILCSERKSFPYIIWNECMGESSYCLQSGDKLANEYFFRSIIEKKNIFSSSYEGILSDINYFISEFLTKDLIFRNKKNEILAIRKVLIKKLEEKYGLTWPSEADLFKFVLNKLKFKIHEKKIDKYDEKKIDYNDYNFFIFNSNCLNDFEISANIANFLKTKLILKSRNNALNFAQISSSPKIYLHNCNLIYAFMSSDICLDKFKCETFGLGKDININSIDLKYENTFIIEESIKNLSITLDFACKIYSCI